VAGIVLAVKSFGVATRSGMKEGPFPIFRLCSSGPTCRYFLMLASSTMDITDDMDSRESSSIAG